MIQIKIPITLTEAQAGAPRSGEEAMLYGFLREHTEAKADVKRPAVLICPGGAYEKLSDREAEPVACRFLAMGCQAFVLKYSIAPNRFPAALLELALAVAKIRENAGRWDIDRDRIVVCGFSAGGHLAACLGVFWNREWMEKSLGIRGERIRPDGLLLCYPVITMGDFGHQVSRERLLGEKAEHKEFREYLSLERQAGPHVPPVFMWHTDEDQTVPLEHSLLFACALRKAGVSLEYHVFPYGRHGIALADQETDKPREEGYIVPCCQVWVGLAKAWILDLKAGEQRDWTQTRVDFT